MIKTSFSYFRTILRSRNNGILNQLFKHNSHNSFFMSRKKFVGKDISIYPIILILFAFMKLEKKLLTNNFRLIYYPTHILKHSFNR